MEAFFVAVEAHQETAWLCAIVLYILLSEVTKIRITITHATTLDGFIRRTVDRVDKAQGGAQGGR